MKGFLLFIVSLPYILLQWLLTLFIIALPLFFGAIIFVPYASLFEKWPKWLWLFYNDDEPLKGSWWEKVKWYGYRNPLANMRKLFKEPKWVVTWGATDSMDKVAGWQIRWRHSVFADSLRITAGKPDPNKGKQEMYFGWKIKSKTPGVGFAWSLRMPLRVWLTLFATFGAVLWVG